MSTARARAGRSRCCSAPGSGSDHLDHELVTWSRRAWCGSSASVTGRRKTTSTAHAGERVFVNSYRNRNHKARCSRVLEVTPNRSATVQRSAIDTENLGRAGPAAAGGFQHVHQYTSDQGWASRRTARPRRVLWPWMSRADPGRPGLTLKSTVARSWSARTLPGH